MSRAYERDSDFLQDQGLQNIARGISDLSDKRPPERLVSDIMGRISTPETSAWTRFWAWLSQPKTFTITPLRLAPAFAIGLALLLLLPLLNSNGKPSESLTNLDLVPVVFTLTETDARSVALIGSFNQWNPAGFEMYRSPIGNAWILEVDIPSGRHEYAFLVDGDKVLPDPKAVFTKDDGFGNRNSVLLANNASPI